MPHNHNHDRTDMPQGQNIAADVEAVKRAADSQHHNRRPAPSPCPSLPSGQVLPHTHSDGHPCNEGRTTAEGGVVRPLVDATVPDPDVPGPLNHCYRCPRPAGDPCPQTRVQGCAYLAPEGLSHREGCNNPHTPDAECSFVADGSDGPQYLGHAIHPAWTDPDHPDTVGYTMPRVERVTDTTASVGPFSMDEDEHGATLSGMILRGGIRFEVPRRPTGEYAREVADQAVALFTGDRNADYGDATDNFQDIADLWSVALRPLLREGAAITAEQVAVCSALIKVARLNNSPTHDDSWVDATAYLALGAGINRRRQDGAE